MSSYRPEDVPMLVTSKLALQYSGSEVSGMIMLLYGFHWVYPTVGCYAMCCQVQSE